MITMYDSVDVSQIPANAQAVAGYVGGKWPTYNALVKQFPHADHLSIAVNATENADCLDIENGDATIADAPAWYKRQAARGVKRIYLYTSLSNIDALVAAMTAAGIPRDRYLIWSAHYTGKPHICGPQEGINTHANGTQYWDAALGRDLDVSLCESDFFNDPTPPNPLIKPANWFPGDEANWIKEWERIKNRNTIAARLRRVFLKAQMSKRRELIWHLTEKTGWKILNRYNRYMKLKQLTS